MRAALTASVFTSLVVRVQPRLIAPPIINKTLILLMRVFARPVPKLLVGLPVLPVAVLVNIYPEASVTITVQAQIPNVDVLPVPIVIIPMAGLMLAQLIPAVMEATSALAKIRNTVITIVREQVVLIQ